MECLVGLLPVNEGAVSFHGAPLPIMHWREATFYFPRWHFLLERSTC